MLNSPCPGRAVRVAGLLVLAVLLTACAGEGTKAKDATPKKSSPEITLASIGLDQVPATDALGSDWPKVPAGFHAEHYHGMVYALRSWGQASTVSRQVRESDNPIGAVGDAIKNFDITYRLEKSFEEQVTPHLSAVSVFHPDVEVVGDPVVTSGWKLSQEPDPKSGVQVLTVTLQTRAAYRVALADGAERVIGVVRSHSLLTGPGPDGQLGIGYGWQSFGVDECAMALEDAFLPDDDVAKATKDLRGFAKALKPTKVRTEPVGGKLKAVDEKLAKRCEADAA